MFWIDNESIWVGGLSSNRALFGGRGLNPFFEIVNKLLAFRHARKGHVPCRLAILEAWLALGVDAALLILRVEPKEEVIEPVGSGCR
jgi:hypothetical protein